MCTNVFLVESLAPTAIFFSAFSTLLKLVSVRRMGEGGWVSGREKSASREHNRRQSHTTSISQGTTRLSVPGMDGAFWGVGKVVRSCDLVMMTDGGGGGVGKGGVREGWGVRVHFVAGDAGMARNQRLAECYANLQGLAQRVIASWLSARSKRMPDIKRRVLAELKPSVL